MSDPAQTPVVVVGAGVMGAGIAGLFAHAGFPTTLVDVDSEALAHAVGALLDRYGSMDGLQTSQDLEAAVANASLVVEAVPEQMSLKADVFRRLLTAPASALLATNTSTMSVSAIGESADPTRVIGMHFFNPPHRMRLLEIVLGKETSKESCDRALVLARHLDKDAIVVRDSPGFATSRLGLVLGNEAMRMVEEGVATAADVDTGMRLGYGHPMGPLELADLVGLDARLNNTRSMFEQTGLEQFRPPAILERLVAERKLGKKSGAGFYDYQDVSRTQDDAAR